MPERPCAVVTGASRGIGRAIAVRLAEDGFDIAFCSRSADDNAEKTRAMVQEHGARCLHAVCDVSDHVATRAFADRAEDELGPVAALVNCAGVARDNPLFRMSIDDWDAVVATNLTGTFNMCRAIAYGMMRRHTGAVVNVSSVVGVTGNAMQSNYAAAKAGINGLTRSLAREVAGFGVRVNAIAPGFIETDMTEGLSTKHRDLALSVIPLRRFGEPAAVADLASFLVSPRADYIVGQVIRIDGGMAL
ncbi:3-oxoacyl-ACP reductase FabG [Actinophytocola sediminis]